MLIANRSRPRPSRVFGCTCFPRESSGLSQTLNASPTLRLEVSRDGENITAGASEEGIDEDARLLGRGLEGGGGEERRR